MHSTKRTLWAVFLVLPLLWGGSVFGFETDDYVPEVTDRVARISFLRGDVQIKRADSQEWERATLNLPIVEGDEITTDRDGRFEIQFNSHTHLRVAENSYLQILKLKDEGIAVSLPQGVMSLRANEFDKDRAFFEIDAPKTTVAIQRSGMYRIDSGIQGSSEIRVTATDGGEARVYAENAGFTLKNGRSAKIIIEGSYAGEYETADASRFADEFDTWALERDAVIAKRLRDAHYDRYYDRDIYGAEDLNDHGEWIHTRKYGYVWRPFRTSISHYADWSPYRYGHWRWVPPYGWTWVNDEPWGWATYHHGRWIWDSGYWVWTPYGYYRHRRNWWHPALVVVSIYNNNVCWYPLPYRYGYYDYNSHWGGRRRRGNNNHNPPIAGNPRPTPTPNAGPVITPVRGGRNLGGPPLQDVPPGGVVTVATSEFGRGKGNFRRPPLSDATTILSKVPDDTQSPPLLPTYKDLGGKVSKEIVTETPPIFVRTAPSVKTGAMDRKSEAPMDQELRKSRIFGDRAPLEINTNQGEIKTVNTGDNSPRKTGAVNRPIVVKRDDSDEPIRQAPTYNPKKEESPRYDPPSRKVEREDAPVRQAPRYDPPPKQEPPRYDPPPKYDPPPRNDPPPRSDPPPKRDDPPPQKSEPKSDGPVDRKKDG